MEAEAQYRAENGEDWSVAYVPPGATRLNLSRASRMTVENYAAEETVPDLRRAEPAQSL